MSTAVQHASSVFSANDQESPRVAGRGNCHIRLSTTRKDVANGSFDGATVSVYTLVNAKPVPFLTGYGADSAPLTFTQEGFAELSLPTEFTSQIFLGVTGAASAPDIDYAITFDDN